MPVLIAALVLSAMADERLVLPMAEGFTTAHHQQARNGTIEERVPKGETAQEWTRMVTLLSLNTQVGAPRYLQQFIGSVAAACPGATAAAAPKPMSKEPGEPLAGRLDCPLNPSTGKPETFLYRIYQGAQRLHMVQVAFRRAPSAADVAWAEGQLSRVIFCERASTLSDCR